MRAILCVLLAASVLAAADKPATASASNSRVQIDATLIPAGDPVKQELGSDLGGYFTLVRVQVTPKTDKPLAIGPDDFLLISSKDGQKSGAYAPTQIAGRGALVVGSRGIGGAVARDETGPVWGPGPGGTIGGPGTVGGEPRRLPGSGGTVGSATSGASVATASVSDGGKEKEDPVLAVLKQKILPTSEAAGPVSGLLYFSLEGKHKPKQLRMQYSGPAGKLFLEFKQ